MPRPFVVANARYRLRQGSRVFWAGAVLLGGYAGLDAILSEGGGTPVQATSTLRLGDGLEAAGATDTAFESSAHLDGVVVRIGDPNPSGYRRVVLRDKNGRCFEMGVAESGGQVKVAAGYGTVPCPAVSVAPVVRGDELSDTDPARAVVVDFVGKWLRGEPVDRLVTGGSGIAPLGGFKTVQVTWVGDLSPTPSTAATGPVSDRVTVSRVLWVEADADGRDMGWRVQVDLDGNARWNVTTVHGGGVIDNVAPATEED